MSSDYNNIKNLCETIIFKISKTLNNKDNDDNLLGKKDASEKLYSFPYKDVAICWLRLYTDASLIKSNLDMALVMTNAPGYERKELIFSFIEEVQKILKGIDENHVLHNHESSSSSKKRKNRLVPVEIGAKYTDNSWTQKLISFEEFVNNWILSNDLIENYNTDNKIEDRKEEAKVVNKEQKEIAYLAQHNLFDQIPSLKDDILIPDYCFVNTVIPFSNLPSSTNNSNDVDDDYNNCKGNENNQKPRKYNPPPDVIINAWFGPKGTISPMHTDPYHNLLAQVVGKKYIRLYSPEETTNLYPFEQDGFLGNTSQVDVEAPDLERFSRFASAKYQECILEPGELLYIPPGWWHYVKSLTISFSERIIF
nr:7425_t:CDS:2 [Entrophospora candida]